MNLLDLFTFPFTGPINGTIWAIRQIYDKAYSEMYDPEKLKADLIQLRIDYEREAISESKYNQKTREIWERLNASDDEDEEELEGDIDGFTTDQGE